MRYISIDIETTGLDPTRNQMIEFGAVMEDTEEDIPIEALPTFHCYFPQDEYVISPLVMDMHRETGLFKRMHGAKCLTLEELEPEFRAWCDWPKITPAGKNFYAFDYEWFGHLWSENTFRRRALDPTMYYLRSTDVVPPDLQTCCIRADIELSDFHTAIGDARTVIKLIRQGMRNA